MPDTKITALTAIGANPIIPSTFPIPMVDLTDTSMAASGTTKKVTVNQILGSGGTATLASATITGDLTVRTNKLAVTSTGVGIGTTTPTAGILLDVVGGTFARFNKGAANQYHLRIGNSAKDYGLYVDIDNNGTNGFALYDITAGVDTFRYVPGASGSWTHYVNGSTAMTLNSTGLGVGVASPSYKLDVAGTAMRIRSASAYSALVVSSQDSNAATRNWAVASTFNNYGDLCFVQSNAQNGDPLTAGTVRFQIDSSGNVGIGVTPSAKLDVAVTGAGTPRVRFTSDSDNPIVEWQRFQGTATNYYGYRIQGGFGALAFLNSNVAAIGSQTWTQAMTLDASGNLLVGSALPVSGGRISGNSSTGPAGRFFSSAGDNQFAAMFDKSSATNTTSQFLIGFTINNQATGSGQINANGASQAAFGTFSDSRLKENIVNLPSQLANILSLRPVEFDYKDGSGHQIGFVAQEMQEVYSDAVGEQNGFLTVTGWSKTEARLVSAIKELAAKVQALEAKLA